MVLPCLSHVAWFKQCNPVWASNHWKPRYLGFTSLHCLNHVASTNRKPGLTKVPGLVRFIITIPAFSSGLFITIPAFCWFFFHYAFSNVSSNDLPEMMQSHTACICLAFPHCVLSNVSLKRLNKKKQNHIGCICLAFPPCAFSNVSSNCLFE